MRFEVPQFIEVEDKIVGPFTWKQFIYLAGGLGIAVVAFLSLPFFLFILVGVPFAGLAGFLAFHQVNNRPFSLFLESLFQYMTNTKLYLWKRNKEQTVRGESMQKTTAMAAPKTPTAPEPKKKLSSLSRQLTLETLDSDEPLKGEHEQKKEPNAN